MKHGFHVYFGGSFFPPHRGHDQILVSLLSHPEVDCVHLVPTFQNPLKEAPQSLDSSVSFKRKLMLAWVASLRTRGISGIEKLKLDTRELDSGRSSYTVDTLRALREETSSDGRAWVLCLGDDGLADLPRWKDVRGLLSNLDEIWVFRRCPRDGGETSFVEMIPPELRALAKWRLLATRILDVSSTQIREAYGRLQTDARQDRLEQLVLPEICQILGESADTP